MARAIANCVCAICGAHFTSYATKANREEAASWEEWASEHFTTCPECYKKQQAAKAAEKYAEITAKYPLPELKGTEKQIAYAATRREQYLVEHDTYIKASARYAKIAKEKSKELIAIADSNNTPLWKALDRSLRSSPSYDAFIVLLFLSGDCREILDTLAGNPTREQTCILIAAHLKKI